MKRLMVRMAFLFTVLVLLASCMGCHQDGVSKEEQARQDAREQFKAKHGD